MASQLKTSTSRGEFGFYASHILTCGSGQEQLRCNTCSTATPHSTCAAGFSIPEPLMRTHAGACAVAAVQPDGY